ncbi:LamG-like jellyroll fold domain-containing protein [Jidongwangia harbinensis]|uniref:LamG-like jellyroll fold domain-containing protein n=1 Tax=Jidongwangia harbinensis TaxID=2878561 RepID=UPI001CD9C2A8|nr:LamG-like jellyroll fold domain-containing protein [Jidongwangia harbinensis]MCA2219134.1 glycoside hydrolase family 2 [Jidongwangia harbinensis]
MFRPTRVIQAAVTAAAVVLSVLTAGPPATAAPADPPRHGLKGEYFQMSAPGARDFGQLGGVALDPNIDFPNLVPSFESMTGRTEHTTARWTGQITAPAAGDYTFHAIGDNGFRLFVDGRAVIDHWVGDWDVEQHSAPVRLDAGRAYDIRLEMFQDTGGANMFLRWSSPALAKQIVPESAFTPPADFQVFPVELTVRESGAALVAAFRGPVTGGGDLAGHLTVEADTTPIPVSGVTVEGARLVVRLGAPVQKGQRVRFSYDGEGGLRAGGEVVPQIVRNAVNHSAHRLMTTWGKNLDTRNPLPEYPRPQQVRPRWQNLNGPWEFAAARDGEQPVFGRTLGERIVVPFPVESQLSGLERHEDHMFYRRLVTVPAGWRIGGGERLRLHFGAVDHHARVWVNGRPVAEHTGGYTAFSADITDAVVPGGKQEIVVAVTDTTGDNQPIGKQSRNPGGIVYTPSSGIWQTVWMEPVPAAAIDDVVTTPARDNRSVTVTAASAGASAQATVTVTARDHRGEKVATATGRANAAITLPIAKPRLWSPDDPYLYDLDVTLAEGAATDRVTSYFGLRTIEVKQVGGFPKLVLNGKPIFSLAMLDQGFYPDGLHTQPSDQALVFDLRAQKDLGFNAVRKHIKVEPARWYYHADRLGLLVWQDFVSANITNEAGQEAFVTEGRRMMRQLHSSPSVIGWIVFNEGWGEWDRAATGRLTESVKAADPSRVVSAHSGVNCCSSKGDSGAGDVIDHHDYVNNDPPFPDATRMAMDGEHGGFTLRTPGHMWPGAPAAIYSGVADKAALTAKYVDNTRTFYLEAAGAELSGSVYTQVTDLENELNGLWTYDRRKIKVDPGPVREINRQVIAAGAAAGGYADYPGAGSWSLDEGTGRVARDGTGDRDLTLTDNAQWAGGKNGKALRFGGDGGFAETASPVVDTRGAYTVSAWVTLDALPGNYATIVSQDGRRRENPFYLQYGQGAFAFSLPGGVRARAPMTPELGRWYHVTGVRDAAGELRLFVDGRRVATTAGGAGDVSTGPLAVGRARWSGQNTDYWNGSIDDVRVVNRALSDAEVAALSAG